MTAADLQAMGRRALEEIGAVLDRIPAADIELLCSEIRAAGRIACYGVGREGLMIKALCMRLMHLGLDAHVVGDMTTPPLGRGDLLLVSAGPGWFSTVEALVGVAAEAGARTAVFTAQPEGRVPARADLVVRLPAQTMADDRGGGTSLLPMGSLYEAVQLVTYDLIALLLRDQLSQTAEDMRGRHTNLE
jgi:6-phospho-3-hexuloisomerase